MNQKKVDKYKKHLEHIDKAEYPAMYAMIKLIITEYENKKRQP